MTLQFFPLHVYVNGSGSDCTLPLIDYAEEGELCSIGDAPAASALKSGSGGVEHVEINPSLSVGLYGVNADAKAEWDHIQQDYAQYADTDCTKGGKCEYRLAWSAGYRLHLLRQSSHGSVSNPTMVAFEAKLDETQVHYSFEAFGLDLAGVYAIAPTPGEFDPERFGPFSVVATSVAQQIAAQGAKIIPVPVALYFGGDYASLAYAKAQAIVLAANGQANGWNHTATRAAATSLGLPLGTFEVAWNVFATPGYAKEWLDTDSELSELEPFANAAPAVPPAPSGLRPDAVAYPRTVLRCQVLDVDVAATVGYQALVQSNTQAERKMVLYEVFRQHGKPTLTNVGGVDYLDTKLSGLVRLKAGYTKVSTKLKGSYAAIAAEAALGISKASFRLDHHGIAPAATNALLSGNIDPSNIPETLAAVAKVQGLLAQEEMHDPAVPSGVLNTPLGPAVDVRLFAGARTIWWVNTYLARGKRLDYFRSWARRYGLDMEEVAAVYRHRGGTPTGSPPDAVVKLAKEWLAKTTSLPHA